MSMDRDEIEALLPFLANDTLEGEERAEAEAFLKDNPDLNAELDALRAIRAQMQAEDEIRSPGEFGLARLLRDVDAEAPQHRSTAPSMIWRIAAAVLLAVAVGQTVLLMQDDNSGDTFELAGEKPAAFTIAVNPTATEETLREVLLAAGVEIVSGPSALGLYELGLLDGVNASEAVVVLQEASDVIQSLETAN